MSQAQRITIAHLYPREMSIYGDYGNVATLVRRLEWRGYEAVVRQVEIGEPFDFDAVDIVFGGGGQDRGQVLVAPDLLRHGETLRRLATAGMPMLLICGLYQLFGRSYVTMTGQRLEGIGVFALETHGASDRMIGNIVIDSAFGRLVGFENHSGQTVLDVAQQPLGRVTKGFGNDTKSKREGAVSGNAVGTYLHGPVLPKNPVLADHLILAALNRRYGVTELASLDDGLEQAAAAIAAKRPQ